mmetsp:Transcript_16739/g.23631  ORF Transcript_16739/g.23631 Transcript_16739/m.23631 type:complete len:1356 (-) Transcript_16739:98-4165(-)
MRELRVEDALLYLDQVKMEFGDRPHIYNEFLDIMKTFKTQQIDTPGVIRRVSSLFHGNKKLVLGFNTFLPEGYKIELPIDGDGPPIAVFRAPGQSSVTQILGPASGAQAPTVGPAADAAAAAAAGGMPPGAAGPGGMTAEQQRQQQQAVAQQQQGSAPGQPPQPQGTATGAPGAAAGGARPPPQQQQLHPSQQPLRSPAPAGGPPPPHSQQQQPGPPQRMPGGVQGPPPGVDPSAAAAAAGVGPPGSAAYNQHMMQMQQQRAQQMSADATAAMVRSAPPGAAAMLGQSAVAAAGQVGPDGKVVSGPVRTMVGPPQQMTGAPPGAVMQQHQQPPPSQQGQQPPQQQLQQPHGAPPPQGQQQQGQQAGGLQQPVEFDHAINYVTTIKKRFAAEPDIYKKFLEILHTYQKEQRGIKEVLDEVSLLFADHPDLLKEFTYFLPDAVQAQAKAQLDQVAKESEARKRAASSKQAIMHTARGMQRQAQGLAQNRSAPGGPVGSMPQGGTPPGVYTPAPAPVPFGATQGRSDEREREICRSAMYGSVSFAPKRPNRRTELTASQAALKHGRPQTIPANPLQPSTAEAAFFDRAKLHLSRKELAPDKPPGSRRHTPYTEFLKCMHLFGSGILTKDELFSLLRGLFMQGHAPKSGANAGGGASNPAVASNAQELLREFEEVMVGRGPYADQETMLKDKSKYGSLSSREFDSTDVERITPSYRTYPGDYPHNLFFSHSGQTEDDASVLNTKAICAPSEKITKQKGIGSPEDYDGVRVRRNAYEETMFRIEDERFEVDMAIERNVMAMRQVEPIAEECTQIRETEERDGQPIGRMHYKLRTRTLNCAQLNAIARLYGDSGDEVLQHLMRHPIAVLPIVYQRLREKDAEWRKAKAELSKRWKTLTEANYEGSLDMQCYFKKKEVETLFSASALIEECKDAEEFSSNPKKLRSSTATKPFLPQFFISEPDDKHLLFQPHLRMPMSNDMSHKDAMDCIVLQSLNGPSIHSSDRERAGRIWSEFVAPWFKFPAHWLLRELRESMKPDKYSTVVKFAPGQSVRTAFGDGKIVSVIEGNPAAALRYKIRLPFGIAYVRPSGIIHGLSSTDKTGFVRSGDKMESMDVPEESEAKKLAQSCEILFATEHMYVFMRLYCLLVSILSDTRDDIHQLEQKLGRKEFNYAGVVTSLHQLISRDIESKAYESYCRKATKGKVYQVAALPKLVKACADALMKVARENKVLSCYDISQLKEMDPIHLREQSLNVAEHASYRIQYDCVDKFIYFCYLPSDADLLLTPQRDPSSATDKDTATSDGDVVMDLDDEDADHDDGGDDNTSEEADTESSRQDRDGLYSSNKEEDDADFEQQSKRPKLK